MTPQIVAIAWFTPEDFKTIRGFSDDGGGMDDSFDEWLQAAGEVVIQAAARGLTVRRVFVKPDAFRAWLAFHNVQNNHESRARFAYDLLAAEYRVKN
jgi:hypothetical protein